MESPLTGAEGATVPADAAAPEIRPYPGLRPFREDESHLFFGRESHRRELLRRLVASRFVAVVGTSGSGKSSLVRAGLFPDLYSGYLPRAGSDWVVVETSPGNNPVGRLAAQFTAAGWPVSPDDLRTNSVQILETAAAHLEPDQHLLVLIDQFEELFRLAARDEPVADHDEKASFVRLLLQAGGLAGAAGDARVHVVIAMRSEFLGRASTFRGLPEAIDQGQYLIPRLSREELRKAIVSPAHVASVEVEEALVQRLLSELGDGEDQLPVLQHALMRTWEICRDAGKGALDHTSYEDSGGLEQALSNDASDVLDDAKRTDPPDAGGPGAEEVVSRVFQALRATDVNGGQTRRPTPVKDLCEIAGCDRGRLERLIEPFRRRSFLLPPPGPALHDETLIDVSHEALLRRWTTLRKWIEEDELHRRLYLRIATRAADEEGSASPDYFAMPLLGLLEKFWKERQPTRAWAVRHHPGFEAARAFLEASSEHQRHEDVKANRRVRLRLAVAVLALIVIVAGGFAFRLYLSNARLDAQSRVLAGQVIAARAANTTADTDLETRTQLAAESLRRQSTPDAQRLLLQSLFSLAAPLQNLAWPQDGDPAAPSSVAAAPSSVALSSDGRVLFAADVNRLRAFDASTGTALFAVAPPAAGVLTLLAGRHARRLVVFSLDSVHILDARTGTELASLPVAGLRAGTLSDDETTAAFVTRTAQVFVCHLSTNCSDMRVVGTTAFSPQDLALSADAAKLVVQGEEDGANERSFALYSTAPFALLKERVLPIAGTSLALAFDRDAVWVCTPTRFASFETFGDDLAPGVSERFPGEANRCAISEQRVVAQHADQTLRVWSDDGFQIGIAGGPVPASAMVALGGPHLAAVGERLRVWRVSRYGAVPSVTGGGTLVGAGTHVAQGTSRILVNLDSGQETTLRVPELPSSWRLAAVADSLQNAVFTNSNVEVLIGKPRVLAYVERDPSGAYVQKWRAAIPFVRGSGLGGFTSICGGRSGHPVSPSPRGGAFSASLHPAPTRSSCWTYPTARS